MRLRTFLPLLAAATLGFPAAASAYFPHVVAAGESLSSIAAADGLTVGQLAAANGLSPDAQLISGSTVMIPPPGGGVVSAAPTSTSTVSSSTGDGDADSDEPGAASSSGSGAYLVQPGDTLTAIAERAGTSAAQLAAANGLDPNGTLLSGTVLQLSGSGSSGTTVPVSTTTSTSAAPATATGGYVVQPGDTLSAIAARAGVSVSELSAGNGLDPNGTLLAGATIMIPGGGGSSVMSSAEGQPVGAVAEGDPTAPPYPTPERVSASEIGSVANANGVPPSLAEAIGWQESGFNNDLVSTADARGVMQILPGTWDWIQRTLTPSAPLASASAASNVRGGVLLLHSLLDSTGGDSAMAAASYYQGLSSVQQNGLFPDTQQYVNSVMRLEQQFGGG
jgi:N-acetylmuramoyl-L-alanine amidase